LTPRGHSARYRHTPENHPDQTTPSKSRASAAHHAASHGGDVGEDLAWGNGYSRQFLVAKKARQMKKYQQRGASPILAILRKPNIGNSRANSTMRDIPQRRQGGMNGHEQIVAVRENLGGQQEESRCGATNKGKRPRFFTNKGMRPRFFSTKGSVPVSSALEVADKISENLAEFIEWKQAS
jgi:hypothetical protein